MLQGLVAGVPEMSAAIPVKIQNTRNVNGIIDTAVLDLHSGIVHLIWRRFLGRDVDVRCLVCSGLVVIREGCVGFGTQIRVKMVGVEWLLVKDDLPIRRKVADSGSALVLLLDLGRVLACQEVAPRSQMAATLHCFAAVFDDLIVQVGVVGGNLILLILLF